MIIITGGAGFIGSSIAKKFLDEGEDVVIFDNLSRKGSEKNIEFIGKKYPKIEFIRGDIRNQNEIENAVNGCDKIFHAASQVAVTTSVEKPREDFEINASGTFNVLEAARKNDCSVVFCSTNKVYGNNVNKIELIEDETRYKFPEKYINGIPESFSIDSEEHTPYGSSKLSADQYVRDYSHIYGVNSIVNRMSCIYGTHQYGTIDQGWISFFIISTLKKNPITIFGNGKQVRDILFGDDLAELVFKEFGNIKKFSGNAYNVGGGHDNTISLLELIKMLEKISDREIKPTFSDWRPADQKVYYSDIRKAIQDFSWSPKVSTEEGIKKLYHWTENNI